MHLHAVPIKLGLDEKPALLHQLWDLVHCGTLSQHGSVHGVVGVRGEEHARGLSVGMVPEGHEDGNGRLIEVSVKAVQVHTDLLQRAANSEQVHGIGVEDGENGILTDPHLHVSHDHPNQPLLKGRGAVHHVHSKGGGAVHHVHSKGGGRGSPSRAQQGGRGSPSRAQQGGGAVHHVHSKGRGAVHHVHSKGRGAVHHVHSKGRGAVHHVHSKGRGVVHHVHSKGEGSPSRPSRAQQGGGQSITCTARGEGQSITCTARGGAGARGEG